MEKIILDTSVLMAIPQLTLDLFHEIDKVCTFSYKLFVLDATIAELERLIKGPSLSKKRAASFALKLVKGQNLTILATDQKGSVDELVSLDGYIVATVDQDLKRRLKEKGTRILTIRQKKYVVFA